MADNSSTSNSSNFIRAIIDEDLRTGKHTTVVTRFPPEPNGYLHIGHAKAVCLNFGIARDYGGSCHLRMDDTNPCKEDEEYVRSIQDDVRWLGFDWKDKYFHAADYYDDLYECAVKLITMGKAYVCELTSEQMRQYRGTLKEPGKESAGRNRTTDENLRMFTDMKEGKYPDGSMTLRAKIDMAHPNINMRDPVLYRIRRAEHVRTGTKWIIYPMYDFAHPLSDAIEGITHSICTLEFEDHRPLYDWFIETLETKARPQQIEFARLNLEYTVMSKRKLLQLVQENHVQGWDDPRMPTISGMRRRGFTPASIRTFAERVGVTKKDSIIEMSTLENCVREDLDTNCPRIMGVLRPLKLVIENFPAGETEWFEAQNHPKRAELGSRRVPFSKEIYIEQDDFMENPPKGYFRLQPGGEVRLKYAYIVKCTKVIKNNNNEVIEVHCCYDPTTKSGNAPDGRKVKGTIHWVAASHALDATVHLYDRLFSVPNPGAGESDFLKQMNPTSLETVRGAKIEPSIGGAPGESRYQFERIGYFTLDRYCNPQQELIFNRTMTLRDSWTKEAVSNNK